MYRTQPAIRLEVLRVLGILGALDPYRHKQSVSGTSKRVTMRSAERDDGTGSADAQGGNDGGKKGEADGGAGGGDDDKGHAAVDDVYAAAAVAVAQAAAADAAAAADEVPPGLTPSSDEYYPVVAIAALMRILRDPSLSSHHSVVIQAAMFIFKSLGLKCVPYLPQVKQKKKNTKIQKCSNF